MKNKGNNKYQVTGRISKQQLQNYLYHYLKRIGGRTMENIKIIIASDSIGETAELVARACISQFNPKECKHEF